MRQTKILVDSCSYFRLAKSIHPLLGIPFGESNYALYLNEYMEVQYKKSPRLIGKFPWITEQEYVQNRKMKLNLSAENKKEIERAYSFIKETQESMELKLLYDDIYCLSYAYVLGISLVSDDSGVKDVAHIYDVDIMSSLELLKLMFECKFIDEAKIIETVEFWMYNNDIPINFRNDFRNCFPKIKLK